MEVTITSRDHIKPSSPTPHHLRTFKLCLLDQLIPTPYATIILFFSPDTRLQCRDVPAKLELLKKSLSTTLTRFYLPTGNLKDNLTVDCDDKGAYYVEAREFLAHPDLLLLCKFLPVDLTPKETYSGSRTANIQANVFECGGITIGVCIAHKILDGAALITILKGCSAAAHSDKAVIPDFDAASLFPTEDLRLRDTSMAAWGSLFKKGKSMTRRFLFDALAIATLKAKAKGSGSERPTSIASVSAFIWQRCLAAAMERRSGIERPSVLTHVVNLWKRMEPPASDSSLGNILWISSAKSLPALANEANHSISRIDRHFVEQLRGANRNDGIMDSLKEMSVASEEDGADHLGFSSWCKLGFNEVDFGWGRPVWVSSYGTSEPVFMNLVILADTREGDGIEAWVTLDEQEMAILEGDGELRTLASVDPSPLTLANGHAAQALHA
ncbi:hypothetical protein BT93_B2733 [Corymbia citriodora subsp. variegata]|nr:hypothetical protein BT93_B2733 [Corymbia citriodora subsp. variegata]